MDFKYQSDIDDILATQAEFGKFVDLGVRQVSRLLKTGVLVTREKKIPVFENIPRYYAYKYAATADIDGLTEAELDLRIKKVDLQRKTREEELATGLTVIRAEFVEFLAKWSKATLQDIDGIEGLIADSMAVCSTCNTQTKIDGRGRERVKEAMIRLANHLDRLHEDIE